MKFTALLVYLGGGGDHIFTLIESEYGQEILEALNFKIFVRNHEGRARVDGSVSDKSGWRASLRRIATTPACSFHNLQQCH